MRDVEGYFAVRRGTAGVKPVITVNQSQFSLPDRVVDHGVIQRLELITTDLVIVSNDLYSYNVESAQPNLPTYLPCLYPGFCLALSCIGVVMCELPADYHVPARWYLAQLQTEPW